MITTLKGDLTKLDFDVIVVGVTNKFQSVPGFSAKVFHDAGEKFNETISGFSSLDIGSAKMVEGYHLPCKKIVLTACPVYGDGKQQEEEYLAACYWNSMSLAYKYMYDEKLEKVHVGFSSLGTSIFGYPNEEACKVALKTIKRLNNKFPETKVIDVCFVCDDTQDYMLYKEALKLR